MKSAEAFLQSLSQDEADLFDSSVSNMEGDALSLETLEKQIESRAVYLLGIREHGAKELKCKLLEKFLETEELCSNQPISSDGVQTLIETVVQRCQEKGWQSDERYLDQAVCSGVAKGWGPVKISQKLQAAMECDERVTHYLDGEDWESVAHNVLAKKYGEAYQPTNQKEQAKRMRFLQSRGFPSELIWKVFRNDN